MDPLYWTESDGEVIIDITDANGAATTTGNFKLGFYTHNTTAAFGTLYTMQSTFSPTTYAAGTSVAQCDTLVNALYAAQDENSNTVTAAELKGLTCTNFDTATTVSGARFRLTFDKDPGVLSTLHFYTFAVAGQTTPANTITYRPTGSCTATPALEEVLIMYSNSAAAAVTGDYRLRFFDVFGEDYITDPITVLQLSLTNVEDVCNGIVSKLINLPNGVISDVTCTAATQSSGAYSYGALLRLRFHKNPGVLKPMEVFSTNVASTVSVTLGAGATTGEFVDRFSLKAYDDKGGDMYVQYLQNGEVGPFNFVDIDAALIVSGNGATNTLLTAAMMVKINDRHLMLSAASTTAGTLKWMYTGSDIVAGTTGNHLVFYSTDTWISLVDAGASAITVSWAVGAKYLTPSKDASAFLTKGALMFVENQYFTVQYSNPSTPWYVYTDRAFGGTQIASLYTSASAPAAISGENIYYRTATATTSTYTYVSPCSNRGACDSSTGVCTCFKGYSNDNCDTQNALVA
jgi:hypothetical protein